jgi:polyribonucleotide nucleotidyltransferase
VKISDKEFILNPTYEELQRSSLDLVVAGTKVGIIMVEAGAKEVSEELILEAIEYGHKSLQETIQLQERLISSSGRSKMKLELKEVDAELLKLIKELSELKLDEINKLSQKEQREEGLDSLCKELTSQLVVEGSKWTAEDIRQALIEIEREEVRRIILDKQIRIDGRMYPQIRPVTCEVGVLPRTHGSSLFTRGQTQSLCVTTLGTRSDEQLIEALEGETLKSFMLHYTFPPFSVGEISPIRGPGRREIGHGALAERALQPVMPSKGEFPYTVRVVSEILESNGSSSMATVCAGSLSLMDAGVPIKKPVSGIAMGLVKEEKGIAILTDISGLEDHYGDMDFKVTGTKDGITALQMDIKIDGVKFEIISKILKESNPARLFVLDKMLEALDKPRASISTFAPRIVTLKINPDKIRDLIGPGGKTIRKIIEQTGVTIDIEDDGTVLVASTDEKASNTALDIIKGLTEEVEVGKIYLGKVKRIAPFGAFCEILSGKEGLIHISELSDRFVNQVEDIVKVGDEVQVKVIDIDEQGRISLSKKQVNG